MRLQPGLVMPGGAVPNGILGIAIDNVPNAITITPINETGPGLSGSINRTFTVTGINVPIVLSLTRSNPSQSASITTSRIDIYVKPAGGSYALVDALGAVPGAVKTITVSNGAEVSLDWIVEGSSAPVQSAFTLLVTNSTAGGTLLAAPAYSLTFTG